MIKKFTLATSVALLLTATAATSETEEINLLDLLDSTPESQIAFNDISDRKPIFPWSRSASL